MPIGEIIKRIPHIKKAHVGPALATNGPARMCTLPGAKGKIGFIAPMSWHFCGSCNRLRLTADGKIRTCLFSETEIDVKTPLRSRRDQTRAGGTVARRGQSQAAPPSSWPVCEAEPSAPGNVRHWRINVTRLLPLSKSHGRKMATCQHGFLQHDPPLPGSHCTAGLAAGGGRAMATGIVDPHLTLRLLDADTIIYSKFLDEINTLIGLYRLTP